MGIEAAISSKDWQAYCSDPKAIGLYNVDGRIVALAKGALGGGAAAAESHRELTSEEHHVLFNQLKLSEEQIACLMRGEPIEDASPVSTEPDTEASLLEMTAKEVEEHIGSWGITDPDKLIEIAKLAAAQDGWGISKHIGNYHITNQEALIEIAKLAAQQNGKGVSEYIENYHIVDPNVRAEIAKLAAQQNGEGVSQYIRNYGITNQAALIAIAKLVAQQNGWAASYYIRNYGIENSAARAEIAKLAAQQSGGGVSYYIKNYDLEGDVLIEIAKLAAQQDGAEVSEYIENYGITNQDALIEIAKLAVQQNGEGASYCIRHYGIRDPQALREIALLAVAQNANSLEVFIGYGMDSEEEFRDQAIQVLRNLFDKKGSRLAEDSTLFKALNELQRYRNLSIMAALAVKCNDFLQKAIPDEVAAYVKACEKKSVHMQLPLLVLAQWGEGEGGDRKEVLDFLQEERDGLRNATTGHMQLLLRFLVDLSREAISDVTRWKLLAKAVEGSKRSTESKKGKKSPAEQEREKSKREEESTRSWSRLAGLATLCDQSTPSRVEAVASASSFSKGLSDGTKALLQARGVISSDAVVDDTFWEQYRETFGQTRVPEALLLYMKTIQPLKDERLMRAAREFVQGVLTGTFHADRYNPARSPHLKKLAEEAPEVFAAWQSGAHTKKLGRTEEPKKEVSVDYVAYFRQKIGDGHAKIGGEEQMPQLLRLVSDEEALRRYQAQDDPTKMPAIPSGGAAAEGRISDAEAMCIQLLHPKTTVEQKKALLDSLPTRLDSRLELNNDIKALRKGPVRGMGELTVVNSDDWQDLFLCGTEVLGSCQRIDGQAELNKCLLDYCLDGKNRLLAVKDASGKIVARCIFRLLWDEEKGRPVLFQERIYPATCLPEHQKALDGLALEIASEMGCPLATCNERGDRTTTIIRLQSYGGPAPYEYVDATNGVEEEGMFTITGAHLVGELGA